MTKSVYQTHILLGLINRPNSIRGIMKNRDILLSKSTYMITALKKLLAEGNLETVSISNETMWMDNVYRLSKKVTVKII